MSLPSRSPETIPALGAAVRAALLIAFAGVLASAWPVPWASVLVSDGVARTLAYVLGLAVMGATFQARARRSGRVPAISGRRSSACVSGNWHTTVAFITLPPAAAFAYASYFVAPLGFDLDASTSVPFGSAGSLVVPILYLVAGPVVEEYYFREVLYREFEVVFGSVPLFVAANAIWFSSIHSPAAMPNALVLGLCCAFLRWRSGGLALPVVTHVLTNVALEIAGKLR